MRAGVATRIECRPSGLIDHRHLPHFQGDGLFVGADFQIFRGYGSNPVKSGRCDGRMEIVNLVGGDRRPPKQRQSYMCEYAVPGRARSPIFALHQSKIGGWAAECDAIPGVVRAHATKCAAPRHKTLEV
jgi:hypothetical protein